MSRRAATQATATNLFILVLNVIGGVLVARWLGPERRGILVAVMVVPTFVTVIGSFGVGPATTYVAAGGSELRRLHATSQAIALVQTLLFVPVGYLVLPLALDRYGEAILDVARWYLWTIPLGLSTAYSVAFLVGRMRIRAANSLQLIIPSGYLLAVCGLGSVGQLTVQKVVVVHLTLNTAVAVTAGVAAFRAAGGRARPSALVARTLMTFGGKSHLGNLSQSLNLRLDNAVLALWLPARAVGLYVVAVNSVSVLNAIAQAARMIFMPRVVRLRAQSDEMSPATAMYRQYIIVLIAVGALLAIGLPVLLPLVFGRAYAAAVPTALVLLVASAVYAAKDTLSVILQAMNEPWQASKAELYALIVTVLGLPLLVTGFGILGAAVTSAFAYSISTLFLLRTLSRRHLIAPSSFVRLRGSDVRRLLRPATDVLTRHRKPKGVTR